MHQLMKVALMVSVLAIIGVVLAAPLMVDPPKRPAATPNTTTEHSTAPAAAPSAPTDAATAPADDEDPDLPNFHKVSDVLYRGGQPTAEGFAKLKEMGIRTVVNLRSFHSDRDEIGSTGLAYEHIYMKAWHPEDKETVRFLQIVSDPARQPVFVHCMHGSDRTGTMCAIYRMALENWPKQKAIDEMTSGDYGFHEIFDNLPEYIEALDIDAMREQAGLASEAEDAQAAEQ